MVLLSEGSLELIWFERILLVQEAQISTGQWRVTLSFTYGTASGRSWVLKHLILRIHWTKKYIFMSSFCCVCGLGCVICCCCCCFCCCFGVFFVIFSPIFYRLHVKQLFSFLYYLNIACEIYTWLLDYMKCATPMDAFWKAGLLHIQL